MVDRCVRCVVFGGHVYVYTRWAVCDWITAFLLSSVSLEALDIVLVAVTHMYIFVESIARTDLDVAPQVWLPELTEDGSIHLKTKDLPFCVAGSGDLLALFRCISSRYSFGTDQKSPNKLGAPGRVFLSSEVCGSFV